MSSQLAQLADQVLEVEALEAFLGEGCVVLSPAERAALDLARALTSGAAAGDAEAADLLPQLGGTLRLPPPLALGGAPVELRFDLPRSYPAHRAPTLGVRTSAPR